MKQEQGVLYIVLSLTWLIMINFDKCVKELEEGGKEQEGNKGREE